MHTENKNQHPQTIMNSCELMVFNSPRSTAKVTPQHNSLCRLPQLCLIPPPDHNYYQIPSISPSLSCALQVFYPPESPGKYKDYFSHWFRSLHCCINK